MMGLARALMISTTPDLLPTGNIDNIKSRAGGVIEQDITINNKKISVLTDKLALLTASGTSQVTLSNGNVFDANFQWSFLYEKINGVWKVVYSHQSQVN